MDFSKHVHMVWFVMLALDDLIALNVKELSAIGKYKDLPMLLVMTHIDEDP